MSADVIPLVPLVRRSGDPYFGVCPHCRRNDGCLNVGRDHWFVCHEHRVKWYIGSNLFSSWREQTEDTFRRNYYRLATYQVVEPVVEEVVFPPPGATTACPF